MDWVRRSFLTLFSRQAAAQSVTHLAKMYASFFRRHVLEILRFCPVAVSPAPQKENPEIFGIIYPDVR